MSFFLSLLERTKWPDSRVRVIASQSAAKLLRDSTSQHISTYMNWVSNLDLEVDVGNALTIYAYANLKNEVTRDDFSTIIQAPSIFSKSRLDLIFQETSRDESWIHHHSGFWREDFSNDRTFEDLFERSSFFGVHILKGLARDHSIPFKQQWAYEWKRIIDNGSPRGFNSYYFRPGHSSNYYTYLIPRAADVMNSALLRTISALVALYGMPSFLASDLMREFVPFFDDLYKEASTGKIPDWGDESADHSIAFLLERMLSDPELCFVSGPWNSSKDEDKFVDISVLKVINKTRTPEPDASVWDSCLGFETSSNRTGVGVLSNKLSERQLDTEHRTDTKIGLFPFVRKWFPNDCPNWMKFKAGRGFIVPSIEGDTSIMSVRPNGGSIEFVNDDILIGYQRFWTHHWSAAYLMKDAPMIGTTVKLTKEYQHDLLSIHNGEVGYIWKFSKLQRTEEYGKYDVYSEYGYVNA